MEQKVQFVLIKVTLVYAGRLMVCRHNPFKIILTSFLYKCPIRILVNYQKDIVKLKK
jgi:hypothetical protein